MRSPSAYKQVPPDAHPLRPTSSPLCSISPSCTTQASSFIEQRFFFTRRAPPPAYKQAPPDSASPPCTTQASSFIGQRFFFHQTRSPSGLQAGPTRQRFSSVHHPGLRLHWATPFFLLNVLSLRLTTRPH